MAEPGLEELREFVVSVSARFVHCRQDAEDIAQDTMLRLLKQRSNGARIRNERAFATRTAACLAIDRLRAERRRSRRLLPATPSETDRALPSDIQRLYDAIASLPARQSAVITLRKLMELDYVDVAAMLGISVANCRSHCRHGLRKLADMLTDDAQPCPRIGWFRPGRGLRIGRLLPA